MPDSEWNDQAAAAFEQGLTWSEWVRRVLKRAVRRAKR
jgi:hypothetical protein